MNSYYMIWRNIISWVVLVVCMMMNDPLIQTGDASDIIQMYGGISQIGEYYVLLRVGGNLGNISQSVMDTKQQHTTTNVSRMLFRVQVDTGSSSLLLSDIDCESCKNKRINQTLEDEKIGNVFKSLLANEQILNDDENMILDQKHRTKKHFKNPKSTNKKAKKTTTAATASDQEFSSQFYNPRKNVSSAEPIMCDSPMCDAGKCNHLECQSQVCGVETKACCSAEEPTMCGFYLQYGGDTSHRVSARGVMYVDQISLRATGDVLDYTITGNNAVIYSALVETGDWPTEVDGILGMGYQLLNCNPTCSKPAFENFPGASDQFSVCMGDHSGLLVLGDYTDNENHQIVTDPKAIQWTPILGGGLLNSYYLLETKAFMVDSIDLVSVALRAVENSKRINDLTMKRLQSAIRTSVVDTGTTLLLLEDQIFLALLIHMRQNYCHIEGVCGPIDQSIFTFGQCYTSLPRFEQFPTFKLHLGPSTVLLIPPELYFIRFLDTDPSVCQQFGGSENINEDKNSASESCAIYCFGIQNSGSSASILGDTILRGYSTVFDRKMSRVGFGPANRTLCGDVHGLSNSQLFPTISGTRSGHQTFLIVHLVGGVLALICGLIILLRVSGVCERHRGYTQIGENV